MSSKPNKPWMKFYPSDWQSDERLRMCSLAARGLWAEMLCVMHKADTYGHLIVKGEAPNNTQLAALTGTPSDSIPELIGELEKFEVFSRTAKGVIYSRRQVRDDKKQRTAAKNGKSGGNPTLSNQKGKTASVKGKLKAPVKAQRLEAIKEEEPEASSGHDPAEIIFEGKIVRINRKDWTSLCAKHHLTDEQLASLMDDRDEFVSRLQESDKRRSKWWIPTMKWLETEAEGVRKSQ